MRRPLLIAVSLLLAAAPSSRPARAEVALDAAGKVKLLGDFTLRLESDWDSQDAASVEREFERLGFPFDEVHEVQINVSKAQLASMVDTG